LRNFSAYYKWRRPKPENGAITTDAVPRWSHGSKGMTDEQKRLVRESFQLMRPVSDLAGELFYHRLFKIDPALRALFRGDLRQQGQKLMQMVAVVVSGLDRMEQLMPAVEDLGRRHATYGVRDDHYDTVGAALVWTLERCLAAAFTSEVKAAWSELYGQLATSMKRAAAPCAMTASTL
jgi:hemoglobin-like flavoprotein